jgi:hypothetical protein
MNILSQHIPYCFSLSPPKITFLEISSILESTSIERQKTSIPNVSSKSPTEVRNLKHVSSGAGEETHSIPCTKFELQFLRDAKKLVPMSAHLLPIAGKLAADSSGNYLTSASCFQHGIASVLTKLEISGRLLDAVPRTNRTSNYNVRVLSKPTSNEPRSYRPAYPNLFVQSGLNVF